MKKIVLIALAIVMALGCVSSFAYFGVVKFDAAASAVGESFNDANIDYTVNEIRNDWTASRGLGTEHAKFIDIAGNTAVEFTDNEFITSDYQLGLKGYATVDIKLVKQDDTTGFVGLALDYSADNFPYGSTTDSWSMLGENTPCASSFGFSLKGKDTVNLFIAGVTGAAGTDSVDIALDFDASADFHTYAIYRDFTDVSTGIAYFYIDGAKVAYFDFSQEAKDAEIPGVPNSWQVGIYAADGTALKQDTNSVGDFNGGTGATGNVLFAISSEEDVDVIIDNIGYGDYTDLPTEDDGGDDNDDDNNDDNPTAETGDVSVIVALVAVAALAVVVLKKRETV